MKRLIVSATSALAVIACERNATGNHEALPPPVATLAAGFEDQAYVALGFDPTSMEFSPDGRLFVAEQQGSLHVIKDGALLPTPFVTVAVEPTSERGLLGVAFDPNYATNRYVYVYYTAAATQRNRVSRFTADAANPDVAPPSSEVVLLDGLAGAAGYHNGGAIHFGTDGKLYIGVGDSHSSLNAQDLTVLEGKLLRINPDGSVPADNPFVGNPSARPEIWALGFRNPFTFAVAPGAGTIHVNDVGESTWEEIDVGRAGANYGWPTCEGPCTDPSMQSPVYAYQHLDGNCAITGGTFYQGTRFPAEYIGAYFFADFCGNWIKVLRSDHSVADFATVASGFVVDLKVGPDGSLYYLSRATQAVHRIVAIAGGNTAPVAIASASPTTGPAPLAVTADASGSSDPNGDSLTYAWDFGDGSGTTGRTVTYTYSRDGAYILTLTVTDQRGGVAQDTLLIHDHAAARRRQLPGGRHHLVRWPGIGRRGWDAGPGRLQLDRAVPPRRTHPSARRSHHERQQRKVRHPHHRRDQRQRVVPDLPDAHRRVGAAHDAHARRAARQGDLQARDRPAGVRAHAGRPAGCDAADRHGRRGDRAYPGCPVAADGRGTGVRLRIVVRWRRRDAQHQHTRGEYDLPRDVSRGAGGDWRRRRHHVDHRRQPRFRRLRRGGG